MKLQEIQATPALRTGERLSRDEFMRRWEALPHLKRAELIGGIVHVVSSPTSEMHGDSHTDVTLLFGTYTASTPGVRANSCSTWYMRDDAPQPENSLRILPNYGGRVTHIERHGRKYSVGAPELAAEVTISTTPQDLTTKRVLYRKAGVNEYLCVLPEKKKILWLALKNREYVELKAKGGVYRSVIFPGLWLDSKALLAGDQLRMLEVLRDGLASPEHASFVARLAELKVRGELHP